MISLNDFCSSCGEGMDVNVAFYDARDDNLIFNVVLYEANKSYKTLSSSYAYATIQTFYTAADLIFCKAYV